MNKDQKITGNITPANKDFETLKRHFPQCFDKSGNLDFEKFKKQLSATEINFSKESYGMDWLGKSYARLLATDETTTLLKEDETFNQKPENANSENLLIKGDNLEVLKHLSNAYYEKIKMIYIDPPYNTGSDGFVYADNRKFTKDELQELAGISEERSKRILDFTQSNSNSHSAWLTFMYPRLYISKQLLKDDGVIFISIDDNEVAQLRLLMDEVFGEDNFVAQLPTVMNLKGNNDEYGFAGTHEYTMVYVKNKDIALLNQFSINEEELEDWQEDEKGFFKQGANLKATGGNAPREKRPNLYFPIFIDDSNTVYVTLDDDKPKKYTGELVTLYPITKEKEMSWRWSKNKFIKDIDDVIVSRNGAIGIYKKQRPALGNLPSKKPKTIFYKPEYSSGNGTAEIKSLFNDKVFTNPKPSKLLKDFIEIGLTDEDIILDFFAGSGTTADAVMQLNAKDDGSRKFILAQLPEKIDPKNNKTAYDFVKEELKAADPTIFEITKERLIRASKTIQEENKDKDLSNQDLGFKIFETMPIWEDYNFEADELDEQQMLLFDENKLTKDDIKALLVTWKTYDGVSLTHSLQETDLNGYTANYSNGKLYLMDKGFKTKNLKTLLEKIDSDKNFNPTTIIAFGYHFESKNLREISENIKSYANKKSIDIDFITRY
ncbi:Type III restriction-modification system methylation subunit (EC [Bathymodiolus thermophilus thioautotrophic gill symbiont]|jgi:adenine-specific DNA-methyltransferase|uniref:site-specific DNA-methyltransferase (adenine-specific) n=1 Tax=Bathymodiolus thermophilus thioautotrophic gill symbiont TaxID=2360 RepID=A0ABM8M767_9GAMM|nr:site-specific DNA-methyltransferase [Bathymodiolus thermophilus thioautotrophic gill symbiont]CAB5498391.1 Type III restriction-modification system methylation subunit (EC [Bathymodiolus thermophilus thioautotrophic gill symbiont]